MSFATLGGVADYPSASSTRDPGGLLVWGAARYHPARFMLLDAIVVQLSCTCTPPKTRK